MFSDKLIKTVIKRGKNMSDLNVKYSADIRINNKKRIIDILRTGSKTKKQIADELDVSIATASSLCNVLIKEGYLLSSSTKNSEGGRIPQKYSLKTEVKYAIALNMVEKDIITLAVVNIYGDIVSQKHISSLQCKSADDLVLFSCKCIEELMKDNEVEKEQLLGIGIAVSGNEMTGTRIIKNCVANPLINNQCIRKGFEEYFQDIPIYIDNEANEAVLVLFQQEQREDPSVENTVYLYIGDGVGVGIVANGRLIEGSHGIGGEINHIQIGKRDYECYCGQKNCIETEISIEGFQRKFFEDMHMEHEFNRYGWEILENAVKEKNEVALSLMKENGTLIGYTISILSQIFDSKTYWIGGFDEFIFNQLHPYILEELKKRSVFRDIIDYHVRFDKGFHSIITRGCYELVFRNWLP